MNTNIMFTYYINTTEYTIMFICNINTTDEYNIMFIYNINETEYNIMFIYYMQYKYNGWMQYYVYIQYKYNRIQYNYILYAPMLLWMKWHCELVHGWMVYTELAPRRQQFHVAPTMQQPKGVISTPLPWILKIRAIKGHRN